jgi:hypothetical protein
MKDLSQLFISQPLADDLLDKFRKDTEKKAKIASKKAFRGPVPKPELPVVQVLTQVPVQAPAPVPTPVPTPVPAPAPAPEPKPKSKPKSKPVYQPPKMPFRATFKGFDVPMRELY